MDETAPDQLDHRPSWDEYFMQICRVVARRSTCLRRQVGAVLVSERRMLATGYNGAPKGLPHCAELGGCYREKMNVPSGERQELCRALHAEQNAIIQAAVHGVKLENVTLYCTTQPCVTCAKMLINCDVRRIVYEAAYPDQLSLQMLAEAGVELVLYVPGEVARDVPGEVARDVAGDVTGEVVGNVDGDVTGEVVGNVDGDVTGEVVGNVDGDVIGEVVGDVAGNVTGEVVGHVTGDVLGDVYVGAVRDVSGNISGDVTGDEGSAQ